VSKISQDGQTLLYDKTLLEAEVERGETVAGEPPKATCGLPCRLYASIQVDDIRKRNCMLSWVAGISGSSVWKVLSDIDGLLIGPAPPCDVRA
jgi:hypothetical protein